MNNKDGSIDWVNFKDTYDNQKGIELKRDILLQAFSLIEYDKKLGDYKVTSEIIELFKKMDSYDLDKLVEQIIDNKGEIKTILNDLLKIDKELFDFVESEYKGEITPEMQKFLGNLLKLQLNTVLRLLRQISIKNEESPKMQNFMNDLISVLGKKIETVNKLQETDLIDRYSGPIIQNKQVFHNTTTSQLETLPQKVELKNKLIPQQIKDVKVYNEIPIKREIINPNKIKKVWPEPIESTLEDDTKIYHPITKQDIHAIPNAINNVVSKPIIHGTTSTQLEPLPQKVELKNKLIPQQIKDVKVYNEIPIKREIINPNKIKKVWPEPIESTLEDDTKIYHPITKQDIHAIPNAINNVVSKPIIHGTTSTQLEPLPQKIQFKNKIGQQMKDVDVYHPITKEDIKVTPTSVESILPKPSEYPIKRENTDVMPNAIENVLGPVAHTIENTQSNPIPKKSNAELQKINDEIDVMIKNIQLSLFRSTDNKNDISKTISETISDILNNKKIIQIGIGGNIGSNDEMVDAKKYIEDAIKLIAKRNSNKDNDIIYRPTKCRWTTTCHKIYDVLMKHANEFKGGKKYKFKYQ